MHEVPSAKSDFWEAAHDATRTILFPFNTAIDWLFGAVLVLVPRLVDNVLGYGQVLTEPGYRVVGVLLVLIALGESWALGKRKITPLVMTIVSIIMGVLAAVLAYFVATSGAPFRPAFLAILWVSIVYLLMNAFWYALVSWNRVAAEISESEPVQLSAVPQPQTGSLVATSGPQSGLCVAMLTAPSERAELIARRLVDERLAACAQVPGEMTSFYWWKEEVKRERERFLFIKTREDLVQAIQEVLADIHPYEVPELILLPVVGGLPAYLDWFQTELRPPTPASSEEPEPTPESLPPDEEAAQTEDQE